MTIVVTGGGTGGHIYPAIAVAEALRVAASGVRVVYVGASGGREEGVAAENGLPFVGLPARKIRRLVSFDTILSLIVLYRGYRQARAQLRALAPDAVVGTGGYVAASAALAAARLGIPVVIHEQNAVAGRTNLRLARSAAHICLTYRESIPQFPPDKATVTGLPIRASLLAGPTRPEARRILGISDEAFVVLVLGGSQGAVAINNVVREAVPAMQAGTFVLHQTGDADAGETPALRTASDAGENGGHLSHRSHSSHESHRSVPARRCDYRAMAHLDTDTLNAAYRAADMVVCRCGASTLAEVACARLPALLVPYPAAYADHQTANASAVAGAGGGVLVPQAELSTERLIREIRILREDPKARSAMAAASAALARPDAARAVARIVLDCARPTRPERPT